MNRIVLLLIITTVAYALAAILSYGPVHSMPLSGYLLALGMGSVVGCAVVSLFSKHRPRPSSAGEFLFDMLGGLIIAASALGTYAIYNSTTLAAAQPLMAVSALVFLAIDVVLFNKVLTRRDTTNLSIGIGMVAVGTFFVESIRFSFNFGILPILVFLMFTFGVGFYLLLYNVKKSNIMRRTMSFPLFMLVIAVISVPATGTSAPSIFYNSGFLPILLAGIFVGAAISMEPFVTLLAKTRSKEHNIVERNFVNTFPYLDTVIVMAGSVLIGSFTLQQIFGGVVIVLGVIMLERIAG